MTPISLVEFLAELELIYAPPIRKPATLRQVRQVVREFAALPGVASTGDLNGRAVALWIASRPDRSAATIEAHLRCLSAVSSYAVHRGWLDSNPLAFRGPSKWVRRDSRPIRRPRPGSRTPEEVGAVLERADLEAVRGWRWRRTRALVYLYAFLGLRRDEALHLRVGDVDAAERRLRLRAHPEDGWTPKTLVSAADLPLPPVLAGVLAGWLIEADSPWVFPADDRGGPWRYGPTPLQAVRALGERAGVRGLSIASFRKTIGTYGKAWGFGPLEVKGLLRHSNLDTQAWYDDGTAESLRPAVDRIGFPRRRSG